MYRLVGGLRREEGSRPVRMRVRGCVCVGERRGRKEIGGRGNHAAVDGKFGNWRQYPPAHCLDRSESGWKEKGKVEKVEKVDSQRWSVSGGSREMRGER